MKIIQVLSNLITEDARFQVFYNKYVLPSGTRQKGILPFEIVKQIAFADPMTRVPDNYDKEGASVEDMLSNQVKVGKYTQWMLNMFIKPHLTDDNNDVIEVNTDKYKSKANEYRRLFIEDLHYFTELLTKYDRFKGSLVDDSKKDINNVKSINELSQLQVEYGDTTVDLSMYRGKKVRNEKGADAQTNFNFPGAEILKVGSEYTLIRISDKGDLGSKAASYFGGYEGGLARGESNWCTASTGSINSHNYRQKGPLYIIIANDDKGKVGEVTGLPTERYQLHFPKPSQFKSRDQYSAEGNVPIVEWLNGKWSEFKEILKPEFAKGFITPNTDNVTIKYPSDETGRFLALYGFEEFFEALPENIKKLNIINTSNERINLELPKSIVRFKSLVALMIQNMISSVPENICELKNLTLLAFPNNEELKSIPECVANLPNFTFLNVNGCPNVQVPEKLEAYNEGNGYYHIEE